MQQPHCKADGYNTSYTIQPGKSTPIDLDTTWSIVESTLSSLFFLCADPCDQAGPGSFFRDTRHYYL